MTSRSRSPAPSSTSWWSLPATPGRSLTREVLLDRVWGYDYLGDSRLVDVAVGRLRARIEPDPTAPELVLTVRGAGYKAARTGS